jgi:hypothetical protein
MRTIAIAFLIAVSPLATSSFAEDARSSAGGDRQWLSIPQVHAKLESAGYRNIEKIERKHGGYEIRAIDRDGQRIKAYVNPITGDTIDQRGSRHNKFDRGASRSSPDCNERRCRDDLPEPATARPARN